MNESQAKTAFDRDTALGRVQGDVELLHEIAELFLDTSSSMLSRIRESIAGRDGNALEFAAHELKGAVGNFGAQCAFNCSKRLEEKGRSGDLSKAEEDYRQLDQEVGRLTEALIALKGESG